MDQNWKCSCTELPDMRKAVPEGHSEQAEEGLLRLPRLGEGTRDPGSGVRPWVSIGCVSVSLKEPSPHKQCLLFTEPGTGIPQIRT